MQHLARHRVHKAKRPSVQSQAFVLPIFVRGLVGTVTLVAKNRVAHFGHVNSDLIAPSGFKVQPH